MKFGKAISGAILLTVCSLCSSAYAGSPLGGDTRGLATIFNNKAEKMSLEQRIALSTCQSEKIVACTYSGGPDIKLLVASDQSKKQIQSITVEFGGTQPKAIHLIATLGTLMSIYSPEASADERGIAFSDLMDQMKSVSKKAATTLHNIRYDAYATDGMGLWFVMSRP